MPISLHLPTPCTSKPYKYTESGWATGRPYGLCTSRAGNVPHFVQEVSFFGSPLFVVQHNNLQLGAWRHFSSTSEPRRSNCAVQLIKPVSV